MRNPYDVSCRQLAAWLRENAPLPDGNPADPLSMGIGVLGFHQGCQDRAPLHGPRDPCRACAVAASITRLKALADEHDLRGCWPETVVAIRAATQPESPIRELVDLLERFLTSPPRVHGPAPTSVEDGRADDARLVDDPILREEVHGPRLWSFDLRPHDHETLCERPARAIALANELLGILTGLDQAIEPHIGATEIASRIEQARAGRTTFDAILTALHDAGFGYGQLAKLIDDGEGGDFEKRKERLKKRLTRASKKET